MSPPSVAAKSICFTLPDPAATVMVNASPEVKSVEPSAMVKVRCVVKATPTVAMPRSIPSGSSTVNLPTLAAGSMQTIW